MLKVMTIVGTRPELIRLSRVIARLDATVDHVLVHTGADEIGARARQTPTQRDHAKQSALDAYAEWRRGREGSTAVEFVLDGLVSGRQP